MRPTTGVGLWKELVEWLAQVSAYTGLSQGQIIRDQREKARAKDRRQSFLELAGAIRGPRDLSARRGFAPVKGIAR